MRSFTFAILAWVCLPAAEAGALRGQTFSDGKDVLSELRLVLSTGGTPEVEQRVANMTQVLRPIFLALPKSSEGFLDASAVRYLLHRYFIDRDGWFVQGSDASGEVADNSLAERILKGGPLATELSESLATRGLSLHEVAVMAVALETLASTEAVERLHAAYRITELSHREGHASEQEIEFILKVYMQMYILGYDYHTLTWAQVNETWGRIYTVSPNWDKMQKWVREVRKEVLTSIPEMRSTFDGQVHVVEEIQHRYGRWQDQDCLSIKEALLKYATPDTGRVPLDTFHSAALPGGWKPLESEDYLQKMGALDVSDPNKPSVVIPNYFDTPSNCATPSKYYSVCCISGCEALLGHLERKLASPDALPQQIVEIVEQLPSPTVEVPRVLSAQLVRRLESIATLHGGHAPLHGRLFRQWMHHAYPSECSFPSLSSAKPMAEATKQDESPAHPVYEVDAVPTDGFSEELPWSDEEELFIVCPAAPRRSKSSMTSPFDIGRSVVLLLIAVSMALTLVQMLVSAKTSVLPQHNKKSNMA